MAAWSWNDDLKPKQLFPPGISESQSKKSMLAFKVYNACSQDLPRYFFYEATPGYLVTWMDTLLI